MNAKLVNDTGIYQNPYVRVAYGTWTLWWLPFSRRFERLYSIPHNMINHLVGLPWQNDRREEGSDQEDDSTPSGLSEDGYCGMKTLQLLLESPRKREKNWETVSVP